MDLAVGQKRRFSFSENDFVIHEIIDTPEIQMVWEWDTGACPHCKKKISRKTNHKFIKIELLLPDGIAKEQATRDNIIVFGNTLDGKNMLMTKDKYNEVFTISKEFTNLVEV